MSQSGVSERTKEIFDRMEEKNGVSTGAGGAGSSATLKGLLGLDNGWSALREGSWKKEPKQIVFPHSSPRTTDSSTTDYDIVVCGGTLGVFYAVAMQLKGYNVCIVERNRVSGRPQEWNISRKELMTLVRLGLLTEEDVESIISIEFNPVRVGFKSDTSPNTTKPGFELYVQDVLNLGIKPDKLIKLMKEKFISGGGFLFEESPIDTIDVYSDNTAVVNFQQADSKVLQQVSSRLIIDAMGNGSPISKQIRGPVEPDGICIVVGGCARGFDAANNTYSDVIYTDTPLTDKTDSQLQYFWEAFPAGSDKTDRTTYLFTYMDSKADRPSVASIFDDYWTLLPRYQGVDVDALDFQRILYGLFPTYRASPLKTPFNCVLQVGDASGIQSPLSFGGFGSLTRHIERVTIGLNEALEHDLLAAKHISKLNPYQPNLSCCWMFQRAMSVPIGGKPKPELVIDTLSNSFSAMETLGDATMRPFLQDVLQFGPLLRTLVLAGKRDLLTPFKIVPHVGLTAMGDFVLHFSMLGFYTLFANTLAEPVNNLVAESDWLDKEAKFGLKRMVEGWKFGSGLDYYDHE